MIRKIDLEIEKVISDVFAEERADIEEEILECRQTLLDVAADKSQVDEDIHDALTRLQGINQVCEHLKNELSKLYQ